LDLVKLFDTTLRDGTQGAGISLSVEDKLKIAQALDEFGIHYIEGGWPASNPKDTLFFHEARKLGLKKARLVSFGSTRKKETASSKDENLRALLDVKTPTVCIFGKSWDMHVTHALRTSLEENLRMISDSVSFLKKHGREVIYDAEHFFDGFRANSDYAINTLKKAADAGADNLTLCDTNGGSIPGAIHEIVREVRRRLPGSALGIHAHNDSDCAVANSLAAVQEGCGLVQGTFNGYGERCGNANLASIIANLKLKLGIDCLTDEKLRTLTETSRYISEVANTVPNDHAPYVGHAAFAHKGGVHVSAVARQTNSYEHVDPAVVGNQRRILISELSGKASIILKAKELNLDFYKNAEAVGKVIAALKTSEHKGYQYEGAEASFALLVQQALGRRRKFFNLKGLHVTVEKDPTDGRMTSEATLKIEVGGREEHTVAEGDGPVDALDRALRKALEKFYPEIRGMSLADFKVRVINASAGTAARVRVLIESRDARDEWGTVGVSENVIDASWQALVDAVEYKLLKHQKKGKRKR
jgi:2-isopropylmalate synthase